MTDIPARLADLDSQAESHGAVDEPPDMGPHPADQPQTDGSSALAPVVTINGKRRPEPLTELGFARRLVGKHGHELRFVVPWNRWLVWNGTRWAPDADGHVPRCMKVIAREVHTALISAKVADPDMIRAAKRAESSSGVKGALTLAATEPEIAITPDKLDAHPYLLNCLNGIVDLQTGELLVHDPGLLLTKMAGAPYEPDADGTEFARFLERIQPGEDMRLFIRRLLGLSLEGKVTAHILPIFYGDGANGKSTLTDAVMNALGDYADAADPDLLRARTFDAHPTGVADLFGLRLALVHETDAGHRLAEGTVKRLTGGDRLKARRMREDFWSFEPSHTFVMLTNHKPGVGGTDEGIWRAAAARTLRCRHPRRRARRGPGLEAGRGSRGDPGMARRWISRLAQERPGRAGQGHRSDASIPGRQRPPRPVPRREVRQGDLVQRP